MVKGSSQLKDIEKKVAQNKLFVGVRNNYIGTHATRETKIMSLSAKTILLAQWVFFKLSVL